MNLFEQQRSNRRKTWLIMIVFVALLCVLGFGFDAFPANGGVYSGRAPGSVTEITRCR